jgi:coenzyme F420-0:L-glutamate ligase/coenzyme F420-1:gamma-L-glutamate ligase
VSGRHELRVLPVEGIPEVTESDRLGELIATRAEIQNGDVVVISQKIVSKAEGRVVRLADVNPSARARELAAKLGKAPSLVELILGESAEVLRAEAGVLICETRQGLVCANAGVDTSNVGEGKATLLPLDPDGSARTIRAQVREATGLAPAVVISDSFGRAWRLGQAEVAIGCAGLRPIDDWRGRNDATGRPLAATVIAVADEAAAAADLVRDKASRIPAALVRGLERLVSAEDGPGAISLRRPRDEDLFR